ncbi:TPR-like protein [Sistotremastrum niveocremeum HHB9708]|uniref:TPR-like protein n=1 Tax=Sistotremastrum niveocremeum HHB9708 TaxID=1314777 RepID=A0A164S0D0_9AGAM|nr:TPR-like protein [Sistotremastrum niveocremeum HHB9708]
MSNTLQERQVRPIYDAIDLGQFKSALQTCNKILKKQPNNELVKTLKCLAMVRIGKIDEAVILSDEILAKKPSDELVLGAMSNVLRFLSRHEDMIVMYEDAYKKNPTNEELGAQTFMANVRVGNWKAAQQVATKMHKNSKDDRYLYWSIMSTVLQASDLSTDPAMRPILLKLALRLIESSGSPSIASPDRFYLNLTVLRDLERYEEALNLLEGDVGKHLCDTSLVLEELRHELAMTLGKRESELQIARTRLTERRDRNWLTFISLIDCTLADHQELEATINETRKLITSLAQEDGTSDRSAALALLELERRCREKELPKRDIPFVESLKSYFVTFGDKPACFEDLKPYIDLQGEEREDWTTFLDTRDLSNASGSISELVRSINVFKLRRMRLIEEEVTVEKEEERAEQYLRAYLAALSLGKGLPSTELQPADDLAILAASAYINLYDLSKSISYLNCATCVLEYASQRSKHAFQHRLLLIRLYRLVGAPSLALEHYRQMNIKQVQNDTLAHLILARCATFSLTSNGDLTYLQECLESSQIYSSNNNETADMVVKAFQFEKYSQIPEFIEFEDRLDSSVQRDLTKIEHVRMRLAHEPATTETIDTELVELKFLYERSQFHHDNRDFSVFPEYQPLGKLINTQTGMGEVSPGEEWLTMWMKMYIICFELASDLDPALDGQAILGGDKSKPLNPIDKDRKALSARLREISEDDYKTLTPEERRLHSFTLALVSWLEPYNTYCRPPPQPFVPGAIALANGSANAAKKVPKPAPTAPSEPPPSTNPPESVLNYFDELEKRFRETAETSTALPWEALHIATLGQEALILYNIVTARFRLGGASKLKKSDPVMQSIKNLRTKALVALKDIGGILVKIGETDATPETRKEFFESCQSITSPNDIDHDFVFGVAKKVTDARKKVRSDIGKGLERICKGQGQGLVLGAGPSTGS